MIKHEKIFDPIERTREMREEEFLKYVEIRGRQKADGTPTDPEKIEAIREKFYGSHLDVGNGALYSMWKFISPKLEANAGLTEFTLDYGGAESAFFFPWLKSVATSPSEALEMSYGAGYNLAGDWTLAPEDDNIDFFVRNDPTFIYNRERQVFVANLVTTLALRSRNEHDLSKVVDLGAGRMAWARWHGFEFDPGWQMVLAFDKDPTIIPVTLFQRPLSELRLDYRQTDMHKALLSPVTMQSDLIMLGGVASYYPMELFVKNVILPVYIQLKKGGIFFFDLQVSCPYLLRSMRVFDWPELVNFAASATEAMDMVDKVRRQLWATGVKFIGEYSLDSGNAIPSSVMVTFTKL